MKAWLRLGLLIFAGCFLLQMLGCASIKEMTRGFLGISTKELEETRKDAVSRNFDFDYFTTYTKSLDALKAMATYVYSKDIKKHMIAVYVSEEDTTPVGIFFREAGKDITQVEVSSPSSFARDLISARLFSVLAGNPITPESKTVSPGPESVMKDNP